MGLNFFSLKELNELYKMNGSNHYHKPEMGPQNSKTEVAIRFAMILYYPTITEAFAYVPCIITEANFGWLIFGWLI